MTVRRGVQHRGAAPGPRRQAGLTLFELVVFILVVAIVFAYAFNRFREYPGAAERANFLAVTAQLKAGVNLQMMKALASGQRAGLAGMEGRNPMDLMQEPPRNYVGEFSMVDEADMPRRVWYFDRRAGELVYLANDSTNLYELRDGERTPADSVRLRVSVVYGGGGWLDETDNSDADTVDGEGLSRGHPQGLRIQPVRPYTWDSVDLQSPAASARAYP